MTDMNDSERALMKGQQPPAFDYQQYMMMQQQYWMYMQQQNSMRDLDGGGGGGNFGQPQASQQSPQNTMSDQIVSGKLGSK